MYGSPNVHKRDVRLRPILSMVNAYNFSLSKFLVNMLAPLCHIPYAVKDSFFLLRRYKVFQTITILWVALMLYLYLRTFQLMKRLAFLKIFCTTVLILSTMVYARNSLRGCRICVAMIICFCSITNCTTRWMVHQWDFVCHLRLRKFS